MRFDFVSFCEDNSIPTKESGHKHCQPGWIQVECPFCSGNPGWHLGWNEASDRFHCWRCGGHPPFEVVAALAEVSNREAGRIFSQYKKRAGAPLADSEGIPPSASMKRPSSAILPPGTGNLRSSHKGYLEGRSFDPELLERRWGLKGTGLTGPYKFRIIAPIYFRHKLVSFQGRDITGRSLTKYKACAKGLERRHHKDCLYGIDYSEQDLAVVVEGIADVWRLGSGALATFGIKYKPSQVQLLKEYKRRFILFDSGDPQAVEQSEKLAATLSAFPGITEIIRLDEGDPADLSDEDARSLMKELRTGSHSMGV